MPWNDSEMCAQVIVQIVGSVQFGSILVFFSYLFSTYLTIGRGKIVWYNDTK